MPRSGALRNFIREYYQSTRWEKLAFIPPAMILSMEVFLLIYDLKHHHEAIVINVTAFLVAISLIEIIIVGREIHEHQKENEERESLTIYLDDYITNTKQLSVQKIVDGFIHKYPEYKNRRIDIYRTSCQILAAHQTEQLEEALAKELRSYLKNKKGQTIERIINTFIEQHPNHKKHRETVYKITAQLMSEEES